MNNEFIEFDSGFYWLRLAEPNLRLLAGVPPDVMKYLAVKDMIAPYKLDGFYTEHGPNSLLLNEDLFVSGMVANLGEFPILQMFYMQGMGLSFHPNFGKERPLIIGMKDRVLSQLKYIKYGNDGLSFREIKEAGVVNNLNYILSYMKARFAGNVDLNALINYKIIAENKNPITIAEGVTLKRLEKNVYQIEHAGKRYEINLNLAPGNSYKPTYKHNKIKLPKAKFLVANTGTGDGWNFRAPCFGSMISFDSKYYLVDCEVFFNEALDAFGLKQKNLSGIFMSHCHDDHMSGLPVIYNSKEKIKIYATSLIYNSLMKKSMALLSISESDFRSHFTHHELKYEEWNNVGGLEVMPVHSAHPVETSIFFFRAKDGKNYKTYAHLGDIAPISVIKKYREAAITNEERTFYSNMISNYLAEVDLKKVDIGGGLIHGLSEDFANDTSKKIILGHYHRDLNEQDLKVGVAQKFGDYDILIE